MCCSFVRELLHKAHQSFRRQFCKSIMNNLIQLFEHTFVPNTHNKRNLSANHDKHHTTSNWPHKICTEYVEHKYVKANQMANCGYKEPTTLSMRNNPWSQQYDATLHKCVSFITSGQDKAIAHTYTLYSGLHTRVARSFLLFFICFFFIFFWVFFSLHVFSFN